MSLLSDEELEKISDTVFSVGNGPHCNLIEIHARKIEQAVIAKLADKLKDAERFDFVINRMTGSELFEMGIDVDYKSDNRVLIDSASAETERKA